MKTQRQRMMLLVVLVWAVGIPIGWAAEGECVRPHFVYVGEDEVKPGQIDAYMKARIADAKLAAQHKFEFPYLTFVQDSRVTTCGIFGAFAQLDGFPQKMEAWDAKTGGKSKQLARDAAKCISRCNGSIVVCRPDLSYIPKVSPFQLDFSKPFYQLLITYRIEPQYYEQAETVAKKIKALYEKSQSPMGYWVYETVAGPDTYTFTAVLGAPDKATFTEWDKKSQETPDPEMEKLTADNAHIVTETEMKEQTFVPEASYVPEGTF